MSAHNDNTKGRGLKIGYLPFDLRHPYWAIQTQASKEQASELGIELVIVPTGSVDDLVKSVRDQVKAIRDLVAQGVAALVIGPADGTDPDLVAAAQQALAAGVPLITTSTVIEGVDVTCEVRSDNFRGGALVAEHLVKQRGGQAKIALIDCPPRLPRIEGFCQALKQYPGSAIVFQDRGDWSYESGARIMQAALSAHPDLDAVYAAGDVMALGAIEAIAQAGRRGEIVVAGCDGSPQALVAIYEGTMSATIDQAPAAAGRLAITAAAQISRGETVPRRHMIQAALVTAEEVTDKALDILSLLPHLLQDLVESTEQQLRLQEEHAAELKREAAERERLQEQIIKAQQRAIQELSTPIIPIMDVPGSTGSIIVMPLIGSIDTMRARDIMRTLLFGISQYRARVVILDITGVPIMDSGVANHLNKTIQAARLKGARTIVTGVSDAVAETIVDLGIDWSNVKTLQNLQAGLLAALGQ